MTNKAIGIGIILPEDLLKELDASRGDVSRSMVIRRLIQSYMKKAKKVDIEI